MKPAIKAKKVRRFFGPLYTSLVFCFGLNELLYRTLETRSRKMLVAQNDFLS